MRVCNAHHVKAVITLRDSKDDAEHDLCEECFEAFNLIVSGEFFKNPDDGSKKRGRPPKATTATV